MEMTPGQIMEAEISATLLDDPSSPWVVIRRTVCEVNLICLTMYFFVVNTMIVLQRWQRSRWQGFPTQLLPSHAWQCFLRGVPLRSNRAQVKIFLIFLIIVTGNNIKRTLRTVLSTNNNCSNFFSCPGLDSDFDQVIWTLVCYFHICRLEIVWIFYLYPPLLYFYHTFIFSHFVSLLHCFFFLFSLLYLLTFIFSHSSIFSLLYFLTFRFLQVVSTSVQPPPALAKWVLVSKSSSPSSLLYTLFIDVLMITIALSDHHYCYHSSSLILPSECYQSHHHSSSINIDTKIT